MANLQKLRNLIDEYRNKYRKETLDPIEESEAYAFESAIELKDVTPKLFWPNDSWPYAGRNGIYAIFSHQQLLYIGKASFQHLGKRLSSYFRFGKNREMQIAPGHTWTSQPTHIITWAVPTEMPFEATALEEFIIRELGEELVDNEIGKRA